MNGLLDAEKVFYERFWALLGDKQLMRVFKKYGPPVLRRSSVLEGFEAFIVAQKFAGKTCVEIGTLKGLTALVLARHFERVISIDIVDDPQKYEIAAMLNVRNIEFVNVRNNAEKAEVIEAVQFDAAYMDGDHAADTREDFRLLKRGGRVLAHEFWDAQPIVAATLQAAGGRIATGGKFALWAAA